MELQEFRKVMACAVSKHYMEDRGKHLLLANCLCLRKGMRDRRNYCTASMDDLQDGHEGLFRGDCDSPGRIYWLGPVIDENRGLRINCLLLFEQYAIDEKLYLEYI